MGRGDRNFGPRRQGGAASQAAIGDPSPRQIADDAENLQQQGERRKGLEAAAKFEAAAAKYEQALGAVVRQRQQLGLALAPSPQDAPTASTSAAVPAPGAAAGRNGGHRGGSSRGGAVTLEEAVEMRASMAECHQLLAEALAEAAAARPDAELSPESERQATEAAIHHLTIAVGHYACCHPAAVLTTAAAGASAADTSASAPLSAFFSAAATAAAAAASAAAALPPDVAVNAGNCLASLGERLEEEAARVAAAPPPTAAEWLSMYDTALGCYRAAATCYRSAIAREEDALTHGNLGDVLVQSGTCRYAAARAVRDHSSSGSSPAAGATNATTIATAADDGACGIMAAAAPQSPSAALITSVLAPCIPAEWAAARESEATADFAAALAAYEAACAQSDSEQGDDLPGLLCNWGAALLSMAGCLQDPAARLPLLEAAAGRLSHAASFDRGDPQPLCSLGDVMAAAGEAAEAMAATAAAQDAKMEGAMAPGAAAGDAGAAAMQHWLRMAGEHLQSALEKGYGAALRLRRDEPEALVGCGEVHLALARLANKYAAAAASTSASCSAVHQQQQDPQQQQQRQHAEAAVGFLRSALAAPQRLGGWRQRCDVRYNMGCALALAGREQEAYEVFRLLLACGAVRQTELAADEDLVPVRQTPWFQALLVMQQQ